MAQSAPADAGPERQYLSMMDQMEIIMDDVMREQGISGYETQCLLWVDGRLDVPRLRAALAQLACRHPVVTARLVKAGKPYAPFWRLRPAGACTLAEHDLATEDAGAALQLAGRLLATPRDLARDNPLSFHLLHRPGGRDVFLVQLSHVAADFKILAPLLREVDRLGCGVAPRAPAAPVVDEDPLAVRLRQIPLRRRLASALNYLDLSFRQLRRPAAVFGSGQALRTRPSMFRCLTRRLDSAQTAAVEARTAKVLGFASLSMTILASAYRAFAAQLGAAAGGFGCATIVGLDLGVRPASRPLFRNLVASVNLHASSAELADRDALIGLLSARLRDGLRRGEDWAVVDLCLRMRRHPRILKAATRRALTEHNSFGFAYFGALDAFGPTFCGAGVDDVSITATIAPPAGMSLLAHKYRGQLTLQAVYLPELVADGEMEAFLTALVDDVRR